MVTVPSSQFSVLGSAIRRSRFAFLVISCGFIGSLLLFASCDQPGNTDNVVQHSESVKATPSAIGGTGLTIDLIEGYAIDSQIDSLFKVYYFKPIDPTEGENEAGIYIGLHPDTSAPGISYEKKTIDGTFMGNSVKWTEFTTAKYTQREVFIDRGPEEKIHSWCYSYDPAVLEKLYSMIRTIR